LFGNRWLRNEASLNAGCSGAVLPPSPPAEKATARQDQAGKARTGDGTGDSSCARYCGDAAATTLRDAPAEALVWAWAPRQSGGCKSHALG